MLFQKTEGRGENIPTRPGIIIGRRGIYSHS